MTIQLIVHFILITFIYFWTIYGYLLSFWAIEIKARWLEMENFSWKGSHFSLNVRWESLLLSFLLFIFGHVLKQSGAITFSHWNSLCSVFDLFLFSILFTKA